MDNFDRSPATHPRPKFWEGLAKGRFLLPRCVQCNYNYSPGAQNCPFCRGSLKWCESEGTGVIYSLMEYHGSASKELSVTAVVQLDAGPRIMGLLEATAGTVAVGARVQAVLQGPRSELPFFALAENPGFGS